jgi:DNA polymerase-3 subunit epsilon
MERYAVIDVETTGLSPKFERLTEIAIIILEDGQIVDEFSTLLNPEKKIPYRITQLTGINNQMVQEAPHFFEVAKQIVQMTEDCTFVAHNASFDYRFIQAEFSRYGFDYQRKILDTVKLSRKLLPGFKSYSLGKLSSQLGIEIQDRHRAMGDAMATAELLIRLLTVNPELSQVKIKGLHSHLKQEQIDAIPHETGVYYFFDDQDQLIYIGKSNNIHSRVISHLNNTTTRKAMEMREKIARVDFEICGSELIALLLESDEIKTHIPIYNRAQRRTANIWGLYPYLNEAGYHCFKILKTNDTEDIPLSVFKSKKAAVSTLELLNEEHQLCQKLNGLYQSSGACFHYSIHQCLGACVGEEEPTEYNPRVESIIDTYQYQNSNLLIIDKGRHELEKSIVIIEGYVYRGFGFVDASELDQPIDVLQSFIKHYPNNKDVATILRSYLKQKKAEAVIEF